MIEKYNPSPGVLSHCLLYLPLPLVDSGFPHSLYSPNTMRNTSEISPIVP